MIADVTSWPGAAVAIVTAVVAGVGAVFAAKAQKNAKAGRQQAAEINDAVNHSEKLGTPRIYDLVLASRADLAELVEWKRGHHNGPLDTGARAVEFADSVRRDVAAVGVRIDDVAARVKQIESRSTEDPNA